MTEELINVASYFEPWLMLCLSAVLLISSLVDLIKNYKQLSEVDVLSTATFLIFVSNSIFYFVADSIHLTTFLKHTIGVTSEGAFFQTLQLYLHRLAFRQKPLEANKMSVISKYQSNNSKLLTAIYLAEIIEVFLLASIVGLFPFFRIDLNFYIDLLILLVMSCAITHISYMKYIIGQYAVKTTYLSAWQLAILSMIFKQLTKAILTDLDDFMLLPSSFASTMIWLACQTVYLSACTVEIAALISCCIHHGDLQ